MSYDEANAVAKILERYVGEAGVGPLLLELANSLPNGPDSHFFRELAWALPKKWRVYIDD